MSVVISIEQLCKTYRLGQIGTGTFTNDLKLWWAKTLGKPNPLARINEINHGNRDGEMVWALKDISFTVEHGEVLGIIGRNGAGKSTLLKILSRVTAPTSGRIRVKGRVASLLEVGTGFHPELTGRENIYLNGAILGMSRREIDRKFDEIVDFAEVEKFIDTPVKRYSSGMYVRLAFAVAAHLEPEILVVDEVLAVGDAQFQKKCLGKMGEEAHKGRTILFVSHNMAAITSLCPRAVYLDKGQFMADGNSDDIVQRYLSRFASHDGADLAARMDRGGNGVVRITSLVFNNKDGTVLDSVISGQDVILQVGYCVPSGVVIESGVCILVFKTQSGQPLFSCSTRLVGEYIRLSPTGQLLCEIQRLPLNQGTYSVDAYIKRGSDSREILDSVEQARQFQVVPGDYFGTGRVANPESSPILVEHGWRGEYDG